MRALHGLPINTVSTEIEPPLSEAAAEAWIPRTCFKNGPPSRVGIELELLVVDTRQPDGLAAHYPRHQYPAFLRELAVGDLDGRLTVEPGGQVELSSRPGTHLQHTVDTVHQDLAALRRRAARCGARLVGIGVDPVRRPRRITDEPRYVAMERYLDAWGSAGRSMMCSTASVQVNVEAAIGSPAAPYATPAAAEPPGTARSVSGSWPDTGATTDPAAAAASANAPLLVTAARPTSPSTVSVLPVCDGAQRWRLLHAIGPALVAAFANSPRRGGVLTGWKSSRQGVWLELDPARTGVVAMNPGEDPSAAWTRWSLDAPVMIVRREHGAWTAPPGLSFREWLRLGRGAIPDRPPPTVDDLAYHLTTLFPQVRPKGHVEVRYVDAQPGKWWTVPTAVIGRLLDDAEAAQQALDACAPVATRWRDAARAGLADAELARSAQRTLEIAAASLHRSTETRWLAGQVEGYLERWTARGRCPADDPLPAEPHTRWRNTEPWGDETR